MTWSTVRLADLARVSSGGGAPQDADAFSAEGVPFVRAGSLVKLLSGQSEEGLELLHPDVAADHRLKLFPSGTVLFAKSGMSATKGHVYQLKKPAYVVSHLAALVPRSEVAGRYLRHVLKFKSPAGLIKDDAYPSIRLGDIENMEVPAPKSEVEQKRIAAILDQTEELRRQRQRALEQLNQLGQAVFIDMFGDPFAVDRSTKSVTLRSLTNRITYGFTSPMSHHDTGIPILTAKNIRDGYIDYNTCSYAIKQEYDSLTDKCKPDKGDVLVTKDGTIGRCSIFESDIACINQSVCLIKPDYTKVRSTYLASYIRLPSVQKRIESMKKGNAIAHLQITEFANFPIVCPELDKQLEFESRLSSIQCNETALKQALMNANALFASLQHRAFRGELVAPAFEGAAA